MRRIFSRYIIKIMPKGIDMTDVQDSLHNSTECAVFGITIPKIVILGIVVYPFYQAVAISSWVGFLLANPPVSHTIPVPSEVSTKDPLGLRLRLAATIT